MQLLNHGSIVFIAILFLSLPYAQAISTKNQSIKSETDQAENLYIKIQASINNLKSRLQENTSSLQQAYDDFEHFEMKIASLTGFATKRGQLAWPAVGKATRQYQKSSSQQTHRDGIYITTASEATVKASHYGKIIFSEWLTGFGLLTIIEHQGGYMTLYGNNSMLLKHAGEYVREGEAIAMTGYGSRGHGLYFEIRKNGISVNPKTWLSAVN